MLGNILPNVKDLIRFEPAASKPLNIEMGGVGVGPTREVGLSFSGGGLLFGVSPNAAVGLF